VKTMSARCPLCGGAFTEGEPMVTAVVRMPFGAVGISFHKRCFADDEARAQRIVRDAVDTAAAFVSSLSSPTPAPAVH